MQESESNFDLSEKQPFDSADPPYGSTNYDWDALEPEQEKIINEKNTSQRRENEQYLHDHPEIHGIISILLRHLLSKKPATAAETQKTAVEFFERPRRQIVKELLDYLLDINCQDFIVYCLQKELEEDDDETSTDAKSMESATTAGRSASQLDDCPDP